MRQAGRSLPEYRAIRERHSFFEVAGTPELCAQVTLQPVRAHGVVRGREIAVGVPVLLSWQIAEGRHALTPPGARLRGGVYD